jgi:hypothetical protein
MSHISTLLTTPKRWRFALSAPLRVRSAPQVLSVTAVGNPTRVGLAAPQPFSAELGDASTHTLKLAAGMPVIATWKAAATRLLPL